MAYGAVAEVCLAIIMGAANASVIEQQRRFERAVRLAEECPPEQWGTAAEILIGARLSACPNNNAEIDVPLGEFLRRHRSALRMNLIEGLPDPTRSLVLPLLAA